MFVSRSQRGSVARPPPPVQYAVPDGVEEVIKQSYLLAQEQIAATKRPNSEIGVKPSMVIQQPDVSLLAEDFFRDVYELYETCESPEQFTAEMEQLDTQFFHRLWQSTQQSSAPNLAVNDPYPVMRSSAAPPRSSIKQPEFIRAPERIAKDPPKHIDSLLTLPTKSLLSEYEKLRGIDSKEEVYVRRSSVSESPLRASRTSPSRITFCEPERRPSRQIPSRGYGPAIQPHRSINVNTSQVLDLSNFDFSSILSTPAGRLDLKNRVQSNRSAVRR
eukprot:GILJ01012230.1.p1 GENE.GILJ01012230.1~~GILJ01012230.1.p1  ORF type:complete len:274 (-),score=10.82 GILJ01012230.1:143-964(-)